MNAVQTKVKERKLDGGKLYASAAGERHLLAQCGLLVIEAHKTILPPLTILKNTFPPLWGRKSIV